MTFPYAHRSVVKTDPVAKRGNQLLKKPLPLEMLPKKNRICGKWGHLWSYTATRKRCTRYLCEVNRPYTPNIHAVRGRSFE
jgi:hypothetical protein